MCGIIGILGREPVAEEIVEALKRLEYRGYDSAGVATLEGGHLTRRRAEGKLKNLEKRLTSEPLAGHSGFVTGLAFDPTGSFLATMSLLGATRLWDPATGLGYGDELAGSPKPGSLEPFIDLPFLGLRNAFSPDGTLLVATGVDTRTMVWDVDNAAWRRRACAIVGRNLNREEWALYLPPGTPYRATCSQWPAD